MVDFIWNLTYSFRLSICTMLMVFDVIYIIASVAIIYCQRYLDSVLRLLDNLAVERHGVFYDRMLLFTGVVTILIHLAGIQIELSIGDWKKLFRSPYRWQLVMIAYIFILMGLVAIYFIAAIVSFSENWYIYWAFSDGLKEAMAEYRDDLQLKLMVDRLQMNYECCGRKDYTDWFNISWAADPDFVKFNVKNKKEVDKVGNMLTLQSVPFSCCRIDADPPCIHLDVKEQQMYKHYEDLTIYTGSCVDSAVNYVSRLVAIYMTLLFFAMSFIQLIMIGAFRLVQTSTDVACSWGDPTQEAPGYIFPLDDELEPPHKMQTMEEYIQRENELEAMAEFDEVKATYDPEQKEKELAKKATDIPDMETSIQKMTEPRRKQSLKAMLTAQEEIPMRTILPIKSTILPILPLVERTVPAAPTSMLPAPQVMPAENDLGVSDQQIVHALEDVLERLSDPSLAAAGRAKPSNGQQKPQKPPPPRPSLPAAAPRTSQVMERKPSLSGKRASLLQAAEAEGLKLRRDLDEPVATEDELGDELDDDAAGPRKGAAKRGRKRAPRRPSTPQVKRPPKRPPAPTRALEKEESPPPRPTAPARKLEKKRSPPPRPPKPSARSPTPPERPPRPRSPRKKKPPKRPPAPSGKLETEKSPPPRPPAPSRRPATPPERPRKPKPPRPKPNVQERPKRPKRPKDTSESSAKPDATEEQDDELDDDAAGARKDDAKRGREREPKKKHKSKSRKKKSKSPRSRDRSSKKRSESRRSRERASKKRSESRRSRERSKRRSKSKNRSGERSKKRAKAKASKSRSEKRRKRRKKNVRRRRGKR